MDTVLRCPHSLIPESVETNRAAFSIIIRIRRAIGLQLPLCSYRHHFQVLVVSGIFRTQRKRKCNIVSYRYPQETRFPSPKLRDRPSLAYSPTSCDCHWASHPGDTALTEQPQQLKPWSCAESGPVGQGTTGLTAQASGPDSGTYSQSLLETRCERIIRLQTSLPLVVPYFSFSWGAESTSS